MVFLAHIRVDFGNELPVASLVGVLAREDVNHFLVLRLERIENRRDSLLVHLVQVNVLRDDMGGSGGGLEGSLRRDDVLDEVRVAVLADLVDQALLLHAVLH